MHDWTRVPNLLALKVGLCCAVTYSKLRCVSASDSVLGQHVLCVQYGSAAPAVAEYRCTPQHMLHSCRAGISGSPRNRYWEMDPLSVSSNRVICLQDLC